MKTGNDILQTAVKHLGEQYIFGASVPKNKEDYHGPWDCAEFVSWCVYQVSGALYGCDRDDANPATADAYTGDWDRDAKRIGTMIDVERAAQIAGAIVLRAPTGNGDGHIVISDGQGGTVEAKGRLYGVVRDTLSDRHWSTGILIPWVDYQQGLQPVAIMPPTELYRAVPPFPRGPRVFELQQKLARLGYSTGLLDGIYGSVTSAAVRAFQGDAGLVLDGEAGQRVFEALDNALAAALPAAPLVGALPAGEAVHVESCAKEIVLDDTITIFKLSDREGFFYQGRMTVDADGAPQCYHPEPDDNLGLDKLEYATANSKRFIQGANGIGPAEGFFVSQTSLQSGPGNHCDSFVDAENIPYIVFYGEKKFPEVKVGDVAVVVSLTTGRRTHAIVGDGNNGTKGEASMKTAGNLGLVSSPRSGGDMHFNYIYLIFPNSKFDPVNPPPHWPDAKIKALAEARFATWGGMDQMRRCFPQIP